MPLGIFTICSMKRAFSAAEFVPAVILAWT